MIVSICFIVCFFRMWHAYPGAHYVSQMFLLKCFLRVRNESISRRLSNLEAERWRPAGSPVDRQEESIDPEGDPISEEFCDEDQDVLIP